MNDQLAVAGNAAMNANMGGIKRGSIDLKLPPNKKQRGGQTPVDQKQSPVQGQRSTVSTSEQDNEPIVVSDSPVIKQQQPPAPVTTATPLGTLPQEMMPGTPSSTASTTLVGTPGPGQRPTQVPNVQLPNVHETARQQGIEQEVIDRLPLKALHCTFILQQVQEKKIVLSPNQYQQIRTLLNERVEAVKKQIALEKQGLATSSPADVNQQQQVQQQQQQTPQSLTQSLPQQQTSMATSMSPVTSAPATSMMPPTTMVAPTTVLTPTPQQQQQLLQQQQQQQQRMLQASMAMSPPVVSAAGVTTLSTTSTPAGGIRSSPTVTPMTPRAPTPSSVAAGSVSTPAATTVAARQVVSTLRPGMGPNDKVENTMMYANDVLKDVASKLSMNFKDELPASAPLEIVKDGHNCALAFDSPLKEGYKDETFSIAPDNDLFKQVKVDDDDVSGCWYESGMDNSINGMDMIMPGFEWDESGVMKV
ncbi:hypothetical protein BDA99DRAFT_523964 [Phascolomyces articulosus]|uniref:Uncharacterized protein n=1 Tax=Phascolomyces articulosus TaxID=60185 RepID=A0AAD5JQC4_9FUNG|nr:hypothetical protein BDA99DRAFT_523964 [Phascolomyces articulosus]